MIWLWIIAAFVLSLLPLIKKRIDIAYYIWLLIPIDSYGVTVMGATIKPYMVFAFILFLVVFSRNKNSDFELTASKGQLLAGVVSVLITIQSMLIGDDLAPFKAAVMAVVVYICAQLSTSCTDYNKSEQLSDVFIAASFGFSAVYLFAYFCMQGGISIDGLVAQERSQAGIFMSMSNMVGGEYVEVARLRGFAYDPNTMFIPFVFGISACVSRLFKRINVYYIITLLMSVLCIILSSSRMGLICCVVTIVITCAVSISQFESVKKKVLSLIAVISLCSTALIVALSSWGQQVLSGLLSTYSNRSGLTDEYGRFSIWSECLEVFWDENPFLGVGLGQMSKYTATQRMTHNTWLEFICECGIIAGGIAVVYFLTVAVIGIVKTRVNHKNHPENTAFLALVIGYAMTLVSLTSVDNVTCSYLWFGALMVLKMSQYASVNQNSSKLT